MSQRLSNAQVSYTILELWDQMLSNDFDIKMIYGDFRKNMFKKRFLLSKGVILQKKYVFLEVSVWEWPEDIGLS